MSFTSPLSHPLGRCLLAASLCGLLWTTSPVQAQSEASVALSLLPLASVVGTVSTGVALAEASVVLPAALSIAGAILTIQAVQVSAVGTVYVLERASDGARVSIEVSARAGVASARAVGEAVACSVIGTGVILSVAGEVLAFIPNTLGKALLYNEPL